LVIYLVIVKLKIAGINKAALIRPPYDKIKEIRTLLTD